MSKKLFSLVIPAYNEEKVIVPILESLISSPLHCEIIIVNDGSNDGTEDLVLEFLRKHKKSKIQYMSHPYNKGYGAALKTGVRAARNEYVMFLNHCWSRWPTMIWSLARG
jgi:glycosyltransferase involved in cell wall biosynthesis